MYEKSITYFFPNLNGNERKYLHKNVLKIIKMICLKNYINENELQTYFLNNDKDFIAIVMLILPFYNNTFNNIQTLKDLFYNERYTNKFVEIKEEKRIEDILNHNTMCVLETVNIVSNKLYCNWKEVIPFSLDNYKEHELYKDTLIKIRKRDLRITSGLYIGDIMNTIMNDLNTNVKKVDFLINEKNGQSFYNIIYEYFYSDIKKEYIYKFQNVIQDAIDYMNKYFSSYNKNKTITVHNFFDKDHIDDWVAYINMVGKIFEHSWYSKNNNLQIYKFCKSFYTVQSNINPLWFDMSEDEQNYYINKFEKIDETILDQICDVVFESLIIKGCLSQINLKQKKFDNKEAHFFLTGKKQQTYVNPFYTMNWISQINFFNHFIHHRVMFLTGGTGVGKSTQAPILLMYAEIMIYYNLMSNIICSVPRKNAVENNAIRMNQQLGLEIGKEYSIQYQHSDDKYIPDYIYSKINLRIVTDEILKNSIFKNIYGVNNTIFSYNHILIDEAHEHKINMDLLITIFKHSLLKFNFHTKIFIISATMDEDDIVYRRFFQEIDDTLILFKSKFIQHGFLLDRRIHISPYNSLNNFDIHEEYLKDVNIDLSYEKSEKFALEKAVDLTYTSMNGTILIFSIGKKEIDNIVTYLNKYIKENTIAIPLYSILDTSYKIAVSSTFLEDWIYDRQYILDIIDKYPSQWKNTNLPYPQKKYSRYIIIGTNIVEASLTISTLKYVIETGYERVSIFNKKIGKEELHILPISESSRIQRRGRVGRVSSGNVYYMYKKDSRKYNKIQKEIINNDISSYLFNLVGYSKVNNENDILSYLEKYDIINNSITKKIQININDDIYFDGLDINKLYNPEFFIIKPNINIYEFYNYHLNHRIWRYLFNQQIYEFIKKVQSTILIKRFTIYDILIFILAYANYSFFDFKKLFDDVTETNIDFKKILIHKDNINSIDENIQLNLLLYFLEKESVKLFTTDNLYIVLTSDLYTETY